VLQPNGAGLYTPKPVASRETVAVHWYGNTYLANSENQPPMESNTISDSNAITPYTGATTGSAVQGYTYGGSNGAIQFGDGVCGFGIVPQQGLWDIQRVMFKSIYTSGDSNSDENLKIKYLGIFPAALTSNTYIHDFTLDSALAVMKFNRATTYSSTLTLGFDAAGGTYYEFIRDSNYNTGTPSYLCGYSQIRGTLNTDLNSAYTCIPFDVNGNFLFYQGLVGSPVPYPYYSDASAALTYLDGTAAPLAKGVVVPRLKTTPDPVRGPPTGYDQTQSKYELSMPIGTNLLNYVAPYPYTQIATPMYPFDPLPYSPSLVVADVSGYIMTQDSYYRVFEYSADTSNYSMVEKYQFTLDQIYPPVDPLINFIGVAANEQEYAFFAYSNEPVPTPGTSKILIRTMRPSDGAVTDTLEIANLVDFDPTVQQITNITYNNYGGFTLGLKQGTTVSAICKHNATTSTMTTFSNADPVLFNANLDRLLTRQSPKESDGLFYVFPYRTGLAGGITEGITDYIKVDPTITDVAHNPFYKYTANTGPQDVWANNTPVVLQVFNLSNATAPQIFRQPIITRQPFKDYVSLLSETDPQRFYQVLSFTTSNTTNVTSNAFTQTSVYQFPSVTSNFTQGANGARWSLIGNTLYGNRNDTVDAPRKVFSAWQLFYPLQRVTMRLVAKNFTFIHDLSGLIYPEYPHTAIAGYDSSGSITADTSRRWGLEASGNFVVADFGFSGVTFNSYVFTFPLKPNTVSKPYYYLTVRNYTPTEKSQVLMRFSLNNKYDFGYVSMADISNEIVYSLTNSNQFTPDYYAGLQAFNSNFVIGSNGRIFGANVVQGYPGSNLSNVTGFGDFYGRFVNIYNQYNEQVQLVQRINAAVKSNVENFIRTELVNILPASSLNRQRFTDPLTFKILWRSALFPQYAKLEENWGLGWNLGFAKADTPYETVHRADSFFKILDDFISLRLNPEYDMNRMDTSAKENLAATKEPTGATKAFHGKLMLANFGSFAQTIISNPVSFYPPLGRMDKLTFQWVDVTGAVINNDNCEWNAVVQIVEKKDMTEISNPPLINPTTRAGTA
jgi:hypothetical protein